MPYTIRQGKGGYQVVKEGDGRVLGTHLTRAKAKRQVRAIYASEGKQAWRGANFNK